MKVAMHGPWIFNDYYIDLNNAIADYYFRSEIVSDHIQNTWPPPSRRTTTSSQHDRPSGVLRRRSDGLERAA